MELLPSRMEWWSLPSAAVGNWGCGVFVQSLGWFNLEWLDGWGTIGITAKELVFIVTVAATWGPQWKGQGVCSNVIIWR